MQLQLKVVGPGIMIDLLMYVAWTVTKILIIVVPLILSVAYFTYAERKVIGYMQVRMGPNRVGPWGLFQPFADVFKLLLKEIILPANSNKFLFVLAPVMAIAPAFAAWGSVARNVSQSVFRRWPNNDSRDIGN